MQISRVSFYIRKTGYWFFGVAFVLTGLGSIGIDPFIALVSLALGGLLLWRGYKMAYKPAVSIEARADDNNRLVTYDVFEARQYEVVALVMLAKTGSRMTSAERALIARYLAAGSQKNLDEDVLDELIKELRPTEQKFRDAAEGLRALPETRRSAFWSCVDKLIEDKREDPICVGKLALLQGFVPRP